MIQRKINCDGCRALIDRQGQGFDCALGFNQVNGVPKELCPKPRTNKALVNYSLRAQEVKSPTDELLERTFLGIPDPDLVKLESQVTFEGFQKIRANDFPTGALCRMMGALASAEIDRRKKLHGGKAI